MRVILLHPNFPGQFRQLAPVLRSAGHDVIGIGARVAPWADTGVCYYSCGGEPQEDLRFSNPEMRLTAQLAHGRRVAAKLRERAAQGWKPDVVLAHPFWGDLLFLDDIYPDAPVVALLEIDFQGLNLDSFDLEFGRTAANDFGANLALRQWADQMAIRRMQQGVTATQFQRNTFPEWQRGRLAVIHEGVNLSQCCPNPLAELTLANGMQLRRGDPVVSFVSRCLEPLRGFATLMRALPSLLRGHSTLQVVVVGQEGHSYGPPPPAEAGSWKRLLMNELGDRVDWSRVHFTGHIAYTQLLRLFQITQAHIYLTYPYVLSWSMLEAMACGAPLIGSATAPVQEVLEHEINGWLVPFFDPESLAEQVLTVVSSSRLQQSVRLAARRTVAHRYEVSACTAQMLQLLERVRRAGRSDGALAQSTAP